MNVWKRLQGLLAGAPRQLGDVTAQHADDTSTVTLVEGGTLRVRGTSVAVGDRAFVVDGRIVGPAPTLPVVIQEE